MSLTVEPIGVVRTGRTDRSMTPVQASANLAEEGRAVLDGQFSAGLDGLDAFTHLWLLTWLGIDADPDDGVPQLRQRPFLRPHGPPVGIFAMRGPRRPVPIGLSLVEIVAVEANTVRFRGVDIVDGTPLLDLKPYFDGADQPRSPVRCGWFDDVGLPLGATPTTLRADPAG